MKISAIRGANGIFPGLLCSAEVKSRVELAWGRPQYPEFQTQMNMKKMDELDLLTYHQYLLTILGESIPWPFP